MIGTFTTVVIEPNPIFREGLIRILSEVGCKVCLGVGCLEELHESPNLRSKQVLFVIDLGTDYNQLVAGIGSIIQRFPTCRIVLLSERYSHDHLLSALRAGASGYLSKTVSCEVLVKSLELVALGQHVFPAETVNLLCNGIPSKPSVEQEASPWLDSLSSREVEVLRYLLYGSANKVIARHFGITEGTVKVHVKAILRKTRVKNRTQAAIWARDHGIEPAAIPSDRNGSTLLTAANGDAR